MIFFDKNTIRSKKKKSLSDFTGPHKKVCVRKACVIYIYITNYNILEHTTYKSCENIRKMSISFPGKRLITICIRVI